MFCHNNNDNHDFNDDDDTDVYPQRLLIYAPVFSGALKSTTRKLSEFHLYLDSDVDSLLNSLLALLTITCSSSNNNVILLLLYFLTNNAMSCARVLLASSVSTIK